MAKYQIIGEVHGPNAVMMYGCMERIAAAAASIVESGPSLEEIDIEMIGKLKVVLTEINESGMREKDPERYRTAMAKIEKVVDEVAERQKAGYDDDAYMRERLRVVGECTDSLKEYNRLFALMEMSQQFEVDTITGTRPEVIYFEGSSLCSLADRARNIAPDFAKEIVLLDKGVQAYLDDDYDESRKTEDREKAWLERMAENGPGLVIIGAGHAQSVKSKLEGLGKEVEIIFDANARDYKKAEA